MVTRARPTRPRTVAVVLMVASSLAPSTPVLAGPSGPAPTYDDQGVWPPRPTGVAASAATPPPVDPPSAPAPGPRRVEPLPVGPGGAAVRYERPHTGGVLQPFDPPSETYGAGHRGVDLDARVDDEVVAAAAGTVSWADRTAGTVWVTVRHADGIRTSYGPLTALAVTAGDAVQRGQPLGRLAAGGHGIGGRDRGLHWSARDRDGHYIDPLTLLGRGTPRPTLVAGGGWEGTAPVVEPYGRWEGSVRGGAFVEGSPIAQRPGYAVAPNWHHLVVVPGLSSDGRPLLRPSFLGYREGDTTVFSYTGCDPTPDGCQPRPYAPVDTHHGVARAARDLEQLLRALQRAQPGRPVDLLGHSQGGIVAAHYLEHHHDPSDPGLPPVANLATFASPFGGAPLANLGDSVSESIVSWGLEGPVRVAGLLSGSPTLGGFRLTSPSVRDLQISTLGRSLGLETGTAAPPAGGGTRMTFLAGSRDFTVPGTRAAPDGADVSYVPGGHSRMARTEAAHQVAHDLLAGRTAPQVDGWGVGFLQHETGVVVDHLAALVDLGNLLTGGGAPVPPGLTVGTRGQEGWLLPDRDGADRPTRP